METVIAQVKQLNRVRHKVAHTVLDFFGRMEKIGQTEFHLQELNDYVSGTTEIAPDSAGRVMRDLRKRGYINYQLVNRGASLYRIV